MHHRTNSSSSSSTLTAPPETATRTIATAVVVKPPPQRTSLRNSVVEAMITSNNLRNCAEVEEMVTKCLQYSKDDQSFVCKSAKRYFRGGLCNNNNININNNVQWNN
eukprot:jgi/Psemu1/307598/fgenesh1_kg.341_\